MSARLAAAPWSTTVKVSSLLAAAVLVAIAVSFFEARLPVHGLPAVLVAVLPPAILAGALLFMVTGYEVSGRTLRVGRLLWSTAVPLDGLEHAWQDPQAMARSMRLFGNSGLFAVTGFFRNGRLGNYRAFVTNPARAVVLRAGDRVVVVSPEDPVAFLARLKAVFPSVQVGPPAP